MISENENYLSTIQIDLLLQCDDALNSFDGNDISSVINKFEEIQILAQSRLSEEQAQPILIATEIGKMSLTYWFENVSQWQQVLNASKSNKQAKTSSWFSWGELAGSDVAGAVYGAVSTAIVNAVPGAGQVAYGTAILSNAVAGSAADAVLQIWNHL